MLWDLIINLISDAYYSIIGWCFLWLRYRDKKQVQYVVDNEFEASCSYAGRIISLNTILVIIGTALMIGLMLSIFIGITELYKYFF